MKGSKPDYLILNGLFQHCFPIDRMFALPDNKIQRFSTVFNSFQQRTFCAYKRFPRTKAVQVDSTAPLVRITG